MKCPKCGRENTPGAPFCADCGKNLFADSAQPAEPAAAAPDTLTVAVTEQAAVEPAPASENVPTPIITDGGIYIAPVAERAAEPQPEPAPEPEPEPEPEPAPEPAPEPQPVSEPVEPPRASVIANTRNDAEPESEPESEPAPAPAPAPEPATEPEKATEPEPEAAPEAEPATEPAPAPEPQLEPAPAPQPEPGAQPPAPEGEPQFAPFATGAPIVPPNPARAHTTYAQAGESLYKKGCLAAAWDDILQTKGWFGKILLLGLIYCVPILNFFVAGYAMRWSRELFLGKVSSMPQRIFGPRTFVNGFFAFVLQLVVSLVVGIVGVILEFIPFVGVIVYLLLAIFVSAFEYLAIMRIAVADRLGAGFDLEQLWRTGKRNFGTLCCATIVPLLIIEAIVMVICLAVGLIMGIPLMGVIAEMASASTYSYYYSDAQAIALVMQVLTIMLPMLLVMYVVMCFFSAFMTVLVMRATGHYVARYAGDWKNEQAVMSTAHINGI